MCIRDRSINFIENMGSIFIFGMVSMILFVLFFVIHEILFRYVNPIFYRWMVYYQKIKQLMMWNFWMRAVLEAFLEFLIAILINIKHIHTQTGSDIFNLIIVISVGTITMLFPIWIVWLICS